MRIKLCSVFVDDQEKALHFYTTVMGFVKKQDLIIGGARWLTLVAPDEPDGAELVLEPSDNPAAQAFKAALREQGIPFTAFAVEDIQAAYQHLKTLGVAFSAPPTPVGDVTVAVLDDTCGNLIQIYQ